MNKVLIDKDMAEAVCKDLLSRVMTDVSADDIEALEQLRKVYKHTIPFSKRLYVASLLLKGVLDGETKTARGAAGRSAQARRREATAGAYGQKAEQKPREAALMRSAASDGNGLPPSDAIKTTVTVAHAAYSHPKVVIDEDKAATIFVGIGKARRVFPRDLVGLFVNAAGIDRERIGDIRVLPNYSFVKVYKEDAEKAISALNGYDYRGKQLAVNYSREKSEDASSESAPALSDEQAEQGETLEGTSEV